MTIERAKPLSGAGAANLIPHELRELEKETQTALKTASIAFGVFAFIAGIVMLATASPIAAVTVGTLGVLAAVISGVALVTLMLRPTFEDPEQKLMKLV